MRLTLLSLLLTATAARGADPAPSIDTTIERIADLRAKQAELAKQEQTAVADLRNQLKALNDKIDALGLDKRPDKKPDDKIVPPPVPPAPVDPLKVKLKAALDASAGSDAQKKEWAKDLAALYRQAAKLVTDPTLTTAVQLRQKLKDASAALIGADALVPVRQVVALELAAVLPTTEADLTDAQRVAAAVLFTKLAVLLDEVAQ